jgi:hypothetical protein
MGLATCRDAWNVHFNNHEIDIYNGKLYTLSPSKTEIAIITSCTSPLNPNWGSICSTGWNVNSVTLTNGTIAKNYAGDWIRSD